MKSFILPDSIIEEVREAGGMLELDFQRKPIIPSSWNIWAAPNISKTPLRCC